MSLFGERRTLKTAYIDARCGSPGRGFRSISSMKNSVKCSIHGRARTTRKLTHELCVPLPLIPCDLRLSLTQRRGRPLQMPSNRGRDREARPAKTLARSYLSESIVKHLVLYCPPRGTSLQGTNAQPRANRKRNGRGPEDHSRSLDHIRMWHRQ